MGLFALAEESSAVIDELIDQGPDPWSSQCRQSEGRASGTPSLRLRFRVKPEACS
jgi:hypothetical protein